MIVNNRAIFMCRFQKRRAQYDVKRRQKPLPRNAANIFFSDFRSKNVKRDSFYGHIWIPREKYMWFDINIATIGQFFESEHF